VTLIRESGSIDDIRQLKQKGTPMLHLKFHTPGGLPNRNRPAGFAEEA
jgi:hypothetical protein